jgi:hypothetical protein
MGILQFQLQAGHNYVKLHQSIARTPVRLVSVAAHFNVENHGFYIARIRFPPIIIGSMNVRNNLYDNTQLMIGLDHKNSYTQRRLDWDLGMVNFPASFQIDVDLDCGVQMVPTANTGYRGAVSYNPMTNVWAPSGATGDNTFTISYGFGEDLPTTERNIVQSTNLSGDSNVTISNSTPASVTIDQSVTWMSVGLLADVMSQQASCPIIGQDYADTLGNSYINNIIIGNPVGLNGAETFYDSTTGEMSGFIPFCYSFILTLEYDGSSTESRVQNLY